MEFVGEFNRQLIKFRSRSASRLGAGDAGESAMARGGYRGVVFTLLDWGSNTSSRKKRG